MTSFCWTKNYGHSNCASKSQNVVNFTIVSTRIVDFLAQEQCELTCDGMSCVGNRTGGSLSAIDCYVLIIN